MTDLTKWRKIRETIQKIGWREITEKVFLDPEGNEQTYVTWNKPGDKGAAIIALTKDKQVVIVEQYRLGIERIMQEIPGGMVDPHEGSESAAMRELLEESGYMTDEPLEYLGYDINDAYTNLERHYYLATNCYQELSPETIADEYIVVKLISIDELIENAKKGKMTDATAVLMAYDRLKQILEG